MSDWRRQSANGNFAAAEESMLAETGAPEGYFPDNEVRGGFYENWGDALAESDLKRAKYEEALTNWQMFASCATSGGEGTARMIDVNRVLKKLERLNADR